jgi:hypothetical protein
LGKGRFSMGMEVGNNTGQARGYDRSESIIWFLCRLLLRSMLSSPTSSSNTMAFWLHWCWNEQALSIQLRLRQTSMPTLLSMLHHFL